MTGDTMTGADGREYVSVVVARSRAFAGACLEAWKDEDGVDRRHQLAWRSIWVPADLLPRARARLGMKAAAD